MSPDDAPHLHRSTPAELKAKLAAEREGVPFLALRDGVGAQRIVALPSDGSAVSLGRDADAEVALEWDRRVSRLHATLEPAGGAWTVGDEGLSRNGTFVNHERVTGRRRLQNGDVIQVGDTELTFHAPSGRDAGETEMASETLVNVDLSRMQRKVLAELCRPLRDKGPYTSPATNAQIAAAVHLSEVAVKTHLRTLFAKFGLAGLPQNQKRASLAESALRSGAVSDRDFAAG